MYDLEKFKNEDVYIKLETQEKYNQVMEWLEEKGFVWASEYALTDDNNWSEYKNETTITNGYTGPGIWYAYEKFHKGEGYTELLPSDKEHIVSTDEEKLKQRVEKHKEIVLSLNELYEEKNRKYGNAFSDTIKKYGYISALTRMNDKFSRIETMTLNEISDDEERLEDSLLDLANYCILYLMELSDTD